MIQDKAGVTIEVGDRVVHTVTGREYKVVGVGDDEFTTQRLDDKTMFEVSNRLASKLWFVVRGRDE